MLARMMVAGWSVAALAVAMASPAVAGVFTFSTGSPNGLIGTLSSPGGGGQLETQTADDFFLPSETLINHATFVGLLPSGASLSSVATVQVGFYDIFPISSTNPPSGNVPSRVNSPSDVAFATASSGAGTLSFTTTLLASTFTVKNTVVNGIHKSPNSFTGGEGPATGEEVLFDVTFTTAFDLEGHDFFSPEVGLTSGNFLWLSAPKPITTGTPFTPDLQSWIRNADLAPDWLRIGTDITGESPFNATFSLSGTSSSTTAVPEPPILLLFASGLLLTGFALRRARA